MPTSTKIACVTRGGRPFTISGYLGADAAAGVYMNLDMNKTAVATSPQDVIFPEQSFITDITVNNAAAPGAAPLLGDIELVFGGVGSGNMIAARGRGAENSGRAPLRIPVRAGTQFRAQVITAMDDV